MNVFLPYENSVEKSVESLDGIRLNKQAVEAYQLLCSALKERNGIEIKGHSNHPVYLFYKNNPDFLAYYGLKCCLEWEWRFNKPHKLTDDFRRKFIINELKFEAPFTPYYMEGSKDDPNCIRTTKNVSELFQAKLIKKWLVDIQRGWEPKWGNRPTPEFWAKYLASTEEERNWYWAKVEILKNSVRS